MLPFCHEENIAVTPYSALAGGRLSRRPGESSKRLEEDSYAKFKYDKTAEQDGEIILRTQIVANRYGVSMTEVALAWLMTRAASPVVGATKLSQLDGLAKATELVLSQDDISYLEAPYVPHELAGVMAQNGRQKAGNVV